MNAMGLHWRLTFSRELKVVNIPYWPHRIIVIGWGRLSRRAVFHPHQPCFYLMTLHHCCERAR